jgi:ADP-ribosylglycohydrolase
MAMERVQVSLRPDEREALRCEARRLGISVSEVVRRAIEPLVKAGADDASREAVDTGDDPDPLLALVGSIKGGPADLSINVKHYLYGAPKREGNGRAP